MVKSYKVEGFEAFKSKVEELAATKDDVYVMFSGSKNADGVRKIFQTKTEILIQNITLFYYFL